jgi:YHYH protein
MVELADEYVDGCLGHPNGPGMYHYHIISPCIIDSSSVDATTPCTNIDSCVSDVKTYALSYYSDYQQETLVGIAKDGHMILGPYDYTGSQFDCTEFDQCGGVYSNDGSYVYIFNNVYPYINNCFGPAEDLVYEASCSSNVCSSYDSSSVFVSAFQALFVMAVSIALFF